MDQSTKQTNKREWLLQVAYGKTCPSLEALIAIRLATKP